MTIDWFSALAEGFPLFLGVSLFVLIIASPFLFALGVMKLIMEIFGLAVDSLVWWIRSWFW